MSEAGYVLTDAWKPRAAWLALSSAERDAYFEDKVVPVLMGAFEKGAEITTVAVNFEQVNFSGPMMDPESLNADTISFPG